MQFLLKPELIQINLSCGELGLTPVEKMELECAVYGEEIVVSVKIARDAKARDLAKAIVDLKKGVNNHFDVDPNIEALLGAQASQVVGTRRHCGDSLERSSRPWISRIVSLM